MKKKELLELKNGILALAMCGVVALTSTGCTAKKTKSESTPSIVAELDYFDEADEKEVLRFIYGRHPRNLKLPENYEFNTVLNINGKEVLVALISEHTFSNKGIPFDGKQGMTAAYFYTSNNQIVIPDMFKSAADLERFNFFKKFDPEISYKIYKDKNSNYYVEKTYTYEINKNHNDAELMKMYGDNITLKEVYRLRYYLHNPDRSAIDYLYRYQEGIGEDCENVVLENTGYYESREATKEDINTLGNHMGLTWHIISR